MPVENGIGHSRATVAKQDGLDKILRQHIATCCRIIAKHSYYPQEYYYFDINAGCGVNREEGCPGSPLVFLDVAANHGIKYQAAFIEKDMDNAAALSDTVFASGCNHNTVFPSDNRETLPSLIENTLPRNAYGMIYHDPNGVPDFDLLSQVFSNPKTRHLDVLIRCSASSIKRSEYISQQKLADYIASVGKEHWIVQELDSSDKWQWTFLLGMNWNGMKSWGEYGFHYLDTPKGEDIFEKLNYSKREREAIRQPELPYRNYQEYLRHPTFRAIRKQVIDKAGGI